MRFSSPPCLHHLLVRLVLLIAILASCQSPIPVDAGSGDAGPNGTPSLSKSSLPTTTTDLGVPSSTTEAAAAAAAGASMITPTASKPKQKKRAKAESPKNKVTSTGTKRVSSSNLSYSQAAFVRRIQNEWRTAIQMGIAYDWVKGKPVKPKKKKFNCDDQNEPDNHHLCLGPLGSNLFVWHFSISGMDQSIYDQGIYHGRVILPPEYPSKPPRVQVWTPSGRFHPRHDICLSASAFHPESWNPSAWNLRTIVESLRLHFLTPPTEVGGMASTPDEKEESAKLSRSWKEPVRLKASKTQQQAYIVVDHAKMIEQGMFPDKGQKETSNDATLDEDSSSSVSSDLTDSPDMDSNQVQTKDDNEMGIFTEKELAVSANDLSSIDFDKAPMRRKGKKSKKKKKMQTACLTTRTNPSSLGKIGVVLSRVAIKLLLWWLMFHILLSVR